MRTALLAPSLDADLARQRAFSDVLSLLADAENLSAAEVSRRVFALARSEGARPDVGRELAACRQRLDALLDALAEIESRLAAITAS